ncbi:DUF2306 domain-containing protein [Marinomonas algicola]|uniref:DUF2306 domain-containing protein n=1 Tax=Marinomonas algicola TaxID=2773454 RepID=UPI00174D2714|nr:DUF2306 domain-containing protein [Marinomonas algicola]
MTYMYLAYFHLATVLPAFFIGTYLLIRRKGTPIHKILGQAYMLLMLISAITSLFMEARIGWQVLGHFGPIHLFSLLVLYLVPTAYIAARTGNIKRHKSNMIGLYLGGLLIAGSFAFMPGRLLHGWLFS